MTNDDVPTFEALSSMTITECTAHQERNASELLEIPRILFVYLMRLFSMWEHNQMSQMQPDEFTTNSRKG